MIITQCIYLTDIESEFTYVKVKYSNDFEETLRAVRNKELFVKPSDFIGLKREEGIQLDTTKVIKNIKTSDLF